MQTKTCGKCEKPIFVEDEIYTCPNCELEFCFDCSDGNNWYCPECGEDLEDQIPE